MEHSTTDRTSAPNTCANQSVQGALLSKSFEDVAKARDWDVINCLDPAYRGEVTAYAFQLHLQDAVSELKELLKDHDKGHAIVRPGPLYDGRRETVVSHQFGYLALLGAHGITYTEFPNRIDRPVKSVRGHENRQSTSGARKLGGHIDHALARAAGEPEDGRHLQPDWLILSTIHNPDRIGTSFASPEEVYERILEVDEQAAEAMEQPEASLPTPPGVHPPRLAMNIPLMIRDELGRPVIRAYPRTIAETERMEHALKVLNAVLEDPSLWTEVALAPGEAVVARGTMLHKRSAVTAERELTAMYGRDNHRHNMLVCDAYPYLEII